ncbi:MAG: M24 family metallopeptidase [Sphingorhabdus sp.]
MPMTPISERDRRWAAAREIMQKRNVDVVIGNGDLGDQWASLRYFSGYRSMYDDAAIMVFRDNDAELVVVHPGVGGFAAWTSWVEQPVMASIPASLESNSQAQHILDKGPTVGGEIANQLNKRGITRVGIADTEHFSSGWKETIEAAVPGVSFVNLAEDVGALRLVKSKYEQDCVREACRISDVIWEQMGDFMQVGRKRYEVLADWETIIRQNGCEDSFNLLLPLPHLKEPLDRAPHSELLVKEGDVFCTEVSPRYHGYYGQQTGIVALGPVSDDIQKAYDAVNRAREAGLKIAKPGVDVVEISAACNKSLEADGYMGNPPVVGHFNGLDLEEPPFGRKSIILEEGMTFIFHPFATGFPAVMRADTYVVTGSGTECLTSENLGPLML